MNNVASNSGTRRKQRGQSIVELALILPLLLVALYIPADFGISFYAANMVANAAREGARIGSGLPKTGGVYTTATADQIRDYVRDHVGVPPWLTSRQLIVKFYDGANCSQYIEVTVQGNYNFFLYQLVRLIGVSMNQNNVTIARTTQMRYNFQTAGAATDALCPTPTSFPAYNI